MPGVSRSGITLTALRFLELKRPDAARLTFLLSIPLTAGAVAWGGRHFLEGFRPGEGPAVLIGVLAAFLAGYLSLRFFMGFLRKKSLLGFALYRVVLGGIVLMMVYFGG
jgi:undecaprenyl-diphosphatase